MGGTRPWGGAATLAALALSSLIAEPVEADEPSAAPPEVFFATTDRASPISRVGLDLASSRLKGSREPIYRLDGYAHLTFGHFGFYSLMPIAYAPDDSSTLEQGNPEIGAFGWVASGEPLALVGRVGFVFGYANDRQFSELAGAARASDLFTYFGYRSTFRASGSALGRGELFSYRVDVGVDVPVPDQRSGCAGYVDCDGLGAPALRLNVALGVDTGGPIVGLELSALRLTGGGWDSTLFGAPGVNDVPPPSDRLGAGLALSATWARGMFAAVAVPLDAPVRDVLAFTVVVGVRPKLGDHRVGSEPATGASGRGSNPQ